MGRGFPAQSLVGNCPKDIPHCFQFGLILGLFELFWALGAIFGVGVRSKNFFGTYLHSLTTFVLEVCGFLALSYFSGWVAGLVENIATSAPN